MKKAFAALVLSLSLLGMMGVGSGLAAAENRARVAEGQGRTTDMEQPGRDWPGLTVNVPGGQLGGYDPQTGDRHSPYPPYTRPDR